MANWHDKDLVYKQHEAMRNMATDRGLFNGQAQLGNALAPPPPHRPPLALMLEKLQKRTAILESLFDQLEGKLGGVLCPTGPETPTGRDGEPAAAASSPLAQELAIIESRLLTLSRRIDSLISRSET